MYYRKNLEVDVHDVDFNGIAKASSLMRYIQSAAQDQLNENGMSYERLKERKRAFILSRVKLDFTESVRAYEKLTATTYPCQSRGFSFLRCYTLEKDGRTIGRAVSVWALIDTETHGLVRVNDFDLGLITHEPHELAINRFSVPDTLAEVGRYTVSYGDLDQNRHMNNTRYPDMYASFLPLENKRIKTISINYHSEALAGEGLRVLLAKATDGLYYIRTLHQDGRINTEAEILLGDL